MTSALPPWKRNKVYELQKPIPVELIVGLNADYQTLSTPNGRVYSNGEFAYPSVTTILSKAGDKDYLDGWKKRVGEEEAARVSKYAADRGSVMHNGLEALIRNGSFNYSKLRPMEAKLFLQCARALDGFEIEKAICIEDILVSHRLKIAGRVDMIAQIGGRVFIVDYKSSTNVKKLEWINSYLAQVEIYAQCFEEQFSEVKIAGSIILVGCEALNAAQVFVVKRSQTKPEMERLYKEGYRNHLESLTESSEPSI